MKRIVFLLSWFVLLGTLMSCSDDNDDVNPPALSFAQSVYTLSADASLVVELQASAAATQNTSVSFTISGTAREGIDYTISAKEFNLKAGETKAQIVITPKDNYTPDMQILLELNAVGGFELGKVKITTITVETKDKIVYSFVTDYHVLAGEVTIEAELKTPDGLAYIATEDIHLPFTISPASTAVKGENFDVEGNVTEFVIPAGKKNASVKLNFLKQENGKDELVLELDNPGEKFMLGNYGKTTIKVYGPTTVGKLFGKWAFKSCDSFEGLKKDYEGLVSASDFTHMPTNNLLTDTLEFIAGDENKLKLHVTGDMKNYFRDCELVYVCDTTVRTGLSTRVVYSLIEMSKVNVSFSASTVNERKAQVGFRILEDEKTLEVTVFDYAPVDFFMEIYDFFKDDPQALMWDAKIQYIFSLVEEE
jgi:calx-beta domain